jgi:class 3 adenylate cyclase
VLIATLVPIYLATLALQVRGSVGRDVRRIGIEVSSASGPREFPVVFSVNSRTEFDGPRLEVGDRLLAAGGDSLAGASALSFWRVAVSAMRRSSSAPIRAARGDQHVATTLVGEPDPYWWVDILRWLPFELIGLLLLVRAPGWPPARRFLISAVAAGVSGKWASLGMDLEAVGNSVVPFSLLHVAGYPIGIGAAVSVYWDFTASARPLRGWMRAQPWIFGLGLFVATTSYCWLPEPGYGIAWLAFNGLTALACCSILAGLTRCYVRSDALERRQLRWILYGLYVLAVPTVWMIASHPTIGPSASEFALMGAVDVAPPLGVLIAVLGYRFLDIDRLISATTSLTILGVALHETIVHVIPDMAETANRWLGVSVSASKWGLSLAFAGFLVGAHGRLRPWIDRRLFPRRVSVEEGLAQLVVELARCPSTQDLTQLSAERVDELLHPESLVVYARAQSAFTPMFARGRAVPPALAADSPLIHILESRTAPLAAGAKEIDPFDRAVLASLGAEVLIPTRRRETLDAFTCLGRKRSGDIYTPAELALLGAVASASSEVLKRLSDSEVLEQSRAMQASLRRYVPGAIAQQLESGRDPQAGEREVTVLFVDLPGYGSGSDKRPVEDVFSTMNEHSERVSRIVHAHGGAVLELHGDGMMAVFGAPEPLAAKERQAVEAAREIVDSAPEGLAVGLGIATGLAYAGNIRAVDRWIWSVIGETTNLAARLQALTRDLGASIAIDEVTRRRAGYVCADFALHREVSVRGGIGRIDVFVLPLARDVVAVA